jgi:WD40 repeat protein
MFETRFDISSSNSRVFGKIIDPKIQQMIREMTCSENLINNKINVYKKHKSEVFCVKLSPDNNILFTGDLSGYLKQHNNQNHKIMQTYQLDCVIWSICFLNSSYILVGGNEKFCLINFHNRVVTKNVFLEQLGSRLAQVIYKMCFIQPNHYSKDPRIICKTDFNFPYMIKLSKLRNVIKHQDKYNSRLQLLKKKDYFPNMSFIN